MANQLVILLLRFSILPSSINSQQTALREYQYITSPVYWIIEELEEYDQDKPPEEVNKFSYLGYDYDNNEFYYLNDSNDKFFVNFFGIESVCNKSQ